MENANETACIQDMTATADNSKQLATSPAGSDLNPNDYFIDVAPGSSKCCKQFNSSRSPNEGLHHDLLNFEGNESSSSQSTESLVCRICHNSENPEKLVSPCLCKGTLTYVHIYCLERWISMSRCTTCELCQFQYHTEQTLRYSLLQSLRIWYSRSMSRRALQEDCQMFSLLTLVAFGIVGTLLVAVQYYILQGHVTGLGRLWTKGWLIFFLISTFMVYLINVYMIFKSQLMPWYRWWQSARDIRLILENHKMPYEELRRMLHRKHSLPQESQEVCNATNEMSISQSTKMSCHQQYSMTTEDSKTLNNCQSNNHTDDDHDKPPCQNIIEYLLPSTSVLNTQTTNNSYSHTDGNNNYLLWPKDVHYDNNAAADIVAVAVTVDSKKKWKITLNGDSNANATPTTTTTSDTIEKVNKSAVATIALSNKNMPLESRYIFDCIAVV